MQLSVIKKSKKPIGYCLNNEKAMKEFFYKTAFILLLVIGSSLFISNLKSIYQHYEWFKQGNRIGINVTDSERPGFYQCSPINSEIQLNEIVGFVLPAIHWVRTRDYLYPDQLLIKHIGAVPGEYLFTKENKIYACHTKNATSDCRLLGECLSSDHKNRPLTCYQWQAYQIPKNNYYLMATRDKYSLDSRYFGLIPLANIRYKASWLFNFYFMRSGSET